MVAGAEGKTVLVVDDEESILALCQDFLDADGFRTEIASTAKAALEKVRESPPDALVLDLIMPEMDGMAFLREVRLLQPDLPVLMVSGVGELEDAVEAMRLGANHFIRKPFWKAELCEAVLRVIEDRRGMASRSTEGAAAEGCPFRRILGSSPAVREIVEGIRATQADGKPLVFVGGKGVGKAELARAVHDSDPSRRGPFLRLSCRDLAARLRRTGGRVAARWTQRWLEREFAPAGRGTLYLDEPAHFGLSTRRAIPEILGREGRARLIVGTRRPATNWDGPADLVPVLLDRNGGVCLRIPPLSEHPEDAVELAELHVEQVCRTLGKSLIPLSRTAREELRGDTGPGNLAMLREAVRRAVLAADDEILAAHLRVREAPAANGAS